MVNFCFKWFNICSNFRSHLLGQRNGYRNFRNKVFRLFPVSLFYGTLYFYYVLPVISESVVHMLAVFTRQFFLWQHWDEILCPMFCIAGNPNMVMALAGNKADLEEKRKVTSEVYLTYFFWGVSQFSSIYHKVAGPRSFYSFGCIENWLPWNLHLPSTLISSNIQMLTKVNPIAWIVWHF